MTFSRQFGTYLTLRFISSMRPGFSLLLMIALAIAALALYFASDTGHAQVPQVTPSTPVLTLRSCDAGCLVIDAGTLTYSDESALTLPDSGTYLASTNAEMPLIEVQWRFTGEEFWQTWDYVTDSNIQWGVRRNDVDGHIEVNELMLRYYDVRVRVRDPEDPENTVSEWSDPATFKPIEWPGVAGINIEFTAGELFGKYPITVSWNNPPEDPGYTSYYVGVSPDGRCEAGPDTLSYEEGGPNFFIAHVTGETSVVFGESEAWTDGVARETLMACVRPAVGTEDGIQVAESLSKGSTPGASKVPTAEYGTINGSPVAPQGVPTDFPPLLDWRKLYLTWTKPEVADGSSIRESEWHYRLSDTVDGNGELVSYEWQEGASVRGSQNWTTIDPSLLNEGISYDVRVRSRASGGWGPWSIQGGFFNNPKPDVPDPPTNIRVTQPRGDIWYSEWVIEWDAPANLGAHKCPERNESTSGDAFGGCLRAELASVDYYEVTLTQGEVVRRHRVSGNAHRRWAFRQHPTKGAAPIFDIDSPINMRVDAHVDGWDRVVTSAELVYTPVRRPSPPAGLRVERGDNYTYKMTWDIPADGGSPLHSFNIYAPCTAMNIDISVTRQGRHWTVTSPHPEYETLKILPSQPTKVTVEIKKGPSLTYKRVCTHFEFTAVNGLGYTSEVAVWRNSPPVVMKQMSDVTGLVAHNQITEVVNGERVAKDFKCEMDSEAIAKAYDKCRVVSYGSVFRDPDGHEMTVSAESSDSMIADVAMFDHPRWIQVYAGSAAGEATITVTATDSEGGSASTTFTVFVESSFDPLEAYDSDSDGRINRDEFQEAKEDYARCVDIAWDSENGELTGVTDPNNKIECTTGELGHPYWNFLRVKKLHFYLHILLSMPDGTAISDHWKATIPKKCGENRQDPRCEGKGDDESIPVVVGDAADKLNKAEVHEDVGTIRIEAELINRPETNITDVTVSIEGIDQNSAGITLNANDDDFEFPVEDANCPFPLEVGSYVCMTVIDDDEPETYVDGGYIHEKFLITATYMVDDITVKDYAELTVIDNEDVVLYPNRAPEVINRIVDLRHPISDPDASPHTPPELSGQLKWRPVLRPTDTIIPIGLIEVFRDRDYGDKLTYTVHSSDESVARVGLVGSVRGYPALEVVIVGTGRTTITATATDSYGLSASDSAPLTVNSIPEVTSEPEKMIVFLGADPTTLDLDDVYTDPDGDTLTYIPISSDETIATSTVDGSVLSVTGVAVGTTSISITAYDDFDTGVATLVPVEVIASSPPKTVGLCTRQYVKSSDGPFTKEFSSRFSGDDLTYTASSSDSAITASMSGSTLSVSRTESGSDTVSSFVTVTASNSAGSASFWFLTYMPAVSGYAACGTGDLLNAPFASTVPPNMVMRFPNELTQTIDLDNYFTDLYQVTLTYRASVSPGDLASATINGSELTVTALRVGTGTVTAYADKAGSESTVYVTFGITAHGAGKLGTAPSLGALPRPTDTPTPTPTPTEVPQVIVIPTPTATPTEVPQQQVLVPTATHTPTPTPTYTPTPTWTPEPDNYPPYAVKSIDDVTFIKESGSIEISLTEVFADDEGDELSFSASSDRLEVASASVSGDILTVTARTKGYAFITVDAVDEHGLDTNTGFSVIVRQVPTLTIESSVTIASGESHWLDVSYLDESSVEFSASSSNTIVATVTVDDDSVMVTGESGGTAEITVTATDADGNRVSRVVNVTVSGPVAPTPTHTPTATLAPTATHTPTPTATPTQPPQNQQPAPVPTATFTPTATPTVTPTPTNTPVPVEPTPPEASQIPDATIAVGETIRISLSDVFSDANGFKTLALDGGSNDSHIVDAYVSGSTLSITGLSAGTAAAWASAWDGTHNLVWAEFSVTVE